MNRADDIEESPKCPACGGLGSFLGILGRLIHFRCRQCGCDFHHAQEQSA